MADNFASDKERLEALKELEKFLTDVKAEKKIFKVQKLTDSFMENPKSLSTSSKVTAVVESGALSEDIRKMASDLCQKCLTDLISEIDKIQSSSPSSKSTTTDVKKKKQRRRSEAEILINEMHAHVLLGVISAVSKPDCQKELATCVLDRNFAPLSHYLLSIGHFCTNYDQCRCYRTPLEEAIETVVLVATAKHLPDKFTEETLDRIENHYKDKISTNFAVGMSLINLKRPLLFERHFSPIVDRLEKVMDAKKDTLRSVLVVRTGPGQFLAQGQPTDFVLVTLERILKQVARKSPHMFTRKATEILDKIYTDRRPMSMTLALDILYSLSESRPDLLLGYGSEYRKIAGEMDSADVDSRKIDRILAVSGALDESGVKKKTSRSRSIPSKKPHKIKNKERRASRATAKDIVR